MRWQWLVGNQCIRGYLQHTGPLEEQVLLQIRPFLEDCILKAGRSISRDTEGGTYLWEKPRHSPPRPSPQPPNEENKALSL